MVEGIARFHHLPYPSQRCQSLGAVAPAATGTRWNGPLCFGLVRRREREGACLPLRRESERKSGSRQNRDRCGRRGVASGRKESVHGNCRREQRREESWVVEQAIAEELERLARMPVAQLRARYREVYGEQTSSGHKPHLVRRIGWRLQVLAQGDLTERAERRARELANDADLKIQVPPGWAPRASRGGDGRPARPAAAGGR